MAGRPRPPASGVGRKRRVAAVVVLLLLTGLLVVQFIRRGPRLVINAQGGGGQLCSLSREQHAFASQLQEYLDSPGFLGDLEKALPEEHELIQAWRTRPYEASVHKNGSVHLYVSYWRVRVNHFPFGALHIDGVPGPQFDLGKDTMDAAREAVERRQRMLATVKGLIHTKLEQLMQDSRASVGPEATDPRIDVDAATPSQSGVQAPESDADGREDVALPFALPRGAGAPWVVSDIRREDGKRITQDEIRKVLELTEEKYRSHKPTRPELPKELKERLLRKIREQKLVDEAYDRLLSRTRNFVLNMMYLEALQILEADPDFVKYRDHPSVKALHDEIERLLAREGRREEESVTEPSARTESEAPVR